MLLFQMKTPKRSAFKSGGEWLFRCWNADHRRSFWLMKSVGLAVSGRSGTVGESTGLPECALVVKDRFCPGGVVFR